MKRSTRYRALLGAALLCGLTLPAAPAMAQRDEYFWQEPRREFVYYKSRLTGNIIPYRHTDPPYDPVDKRHIFLPVSPYKNLQFDALDEINYETVRISDANGIIRELNEWRNSMGNRAVIEFGAVVTQTGTIAKEQRATFYDIMISRAESEARIIAIGKVFQQMKSRLTRDGMVWYGHLMETEQANIDYANDTIARLDATQRNAVLIDIGSLGLARLGGWAAQGFNKLRGAGQTATTEGSRVVTALEQRAAAQSADDVARQALVRAEGRAAEAATRRAAVQEAEQGLARGAAEAPALREAARSATTTFEREAAKATAAQAAAAERAAQARAAQELADLAETRLVSANANAARARTATQAADDTLAAATREAEAAARNQVTAQQAQAASRQAVQEAERQVYLKYADARTARRLAKAGLDRAQATARSATGAEAKAAAQAAEQEANAAYRAALAAENEARLAYGAAQQATSQAQRGVATSGAEALDEGVRRALAEEQAARTAFTGATAQSEAAATRLATARQSAESAARDAAGSEAARNVALREAAESRVRAQTAREAANLAENELQAATRSALQAGEAADDAVRAVTANLEQRMQAAARLLGAAREAADAAGTALTDAGSAWAMANTEYANAISALVHEQSQRGFVTAAANEAVEAAVRNQAAAAGLLAQTGERLAEAQARLAATARTEALLKWLPDLTGFSTNPNTGALPNSLEYLMNSKLVGFAIELAGTVTGNQLSSIPETSSDWQNSLYGLINDLGDMLPTLSQFSRPGSQSGSPPATAGPAPAGGVAPVASGGVADVDSGSGVAPVGSGAGIAPVGSDTGVASIRSQTGALPAERLLERLRNMTPEDRELYDEFMRSAPDWLREFYEQMRDSRKPVLPPPLVDEEAAGPATGPGAAPGTAPTPLGPATGSIALVDSTAPPGGKNAVEPDLGPPPPPTKLETEPNRAGKTGDAGGTGLGPVPPSPPAGALLFFNPVKGLLEVGGGMGFGFSGTVPPLDFTISPSPLLPPKEEPRTQPTSPPPPATSLQGGTTTGVLTEEERAARLAAIRGARTGRADRNSTPVQQPFGRPEDNDLEHQLQSDIALRQRDVAIQLAERERERQRDEQQKASSKPDSGSSNGSGVIPGMRGNPVTPTGGTMPVGVPSPEPVTGADPEPVGAIGVSPPVSEPVLAQPPASPASPPASYSTGITGVWQFSDKSSGVSQISISASGGGYILSGMGGPVFLEDGGNGSYYGSGATLFGQDSHNIEIRQTGSGYQLLASHPSGGSFATSLTK